MSQPFLKVCEGFARICSCVEEMTKIMATLTLKLCVALHQGSKTRDVASG
jgi:hypothetical protein